VTWREARDNSRARREAQAEAAQFLAREYRTGGVVVSFGSLSGVLREAGIPIREALNEGNHPAWEAALARPEIFLCEEWALSVPGDDVSAMIGRAVEHGRVYRLRKRITVKDAVFEIHHLD